MELTLRTVPILGICLVIATCFTAPADAYEPTPSPLTNDPFASAPVQTGGDPPKSPLRSPLADDPFPSAPAQMGGDPPMTPASPVPSPLVDEPMGTAPAQRGGDPPMTPASPVPSPLADEPTGTAPAQRGGDPPMTPVSLVGVFNVMDYGAVADGETDSSMAFLSAWEEACAHPGNSTVYVPNNTFLVGPISFTGPCCNPYSPRVEVRGTLKAPTSPSQFPSSNWIVFRDLHGLVLTGETGRALFDGQGSEAWSDPSCQKKSRCNKLITSLRLSNVSHAMIYHINLLNGKSFHMSIYRSSNIRVHKVSIMAPGDSPNTDGIHVSHSANISITSSTIGVGDDCVSIGPGNTNISVSYIDCGPGHGISVGSLGKVKNEEKVELIRVSNCTINGTQNGVRVKTWPGAPPSEASDMIFENIVMTNVTNPIIIDQEYCPSKQCDVQKASLVKLNNMLFKNITGTYNSKEAVTMLCSPSVPCENVLLIGVRLNWTEQADPRAGHVSLKGLIQGLEIINSSF